MPPRTKPKQRVAPQAARRSGRPIHVAMITEAGGPHLGSYFEGLALAEEVGSVALCDPSGESDALARTSLGDKLTGSYTDLTAMLRDEAPTLAVVSVAAANSPPIVNALLDADCHVLAEKPACVRIEDFEKLHKKARARNLHLVLALANRVDPVVLEAKRLVREGTIGKVYGVEVHFIADQTRLTDPAYQKRWFAQKERAGGGHLTWLGIHWVDLAMMVTGSPVRSVTGFIANVGGNPIDVEDSAVVAMRFENGALGTMTSGYYLDTGYQSHLKVWGSHGWLRVHKHGGTPLEWYSTQDADPGVRRFDGPEGPAVDSYLPFVRAVARACAGLQEIPLTADDSLRVLQAIFACYRAAETGQTQRI